MSCEDVQSELVAWLDAEATTIQGAHVGAHLAKCAECARELLETERARGLLEGLDCALDPPGGSFESLWRRVQDSSDFGRAASYRGGASRRRAGSWRRTVRWSLPVGMAAAAVAAVVLYWEPPSTPARRPPARMRQEAKAFPRHEPPPASVVAVPLELRERPDLFVDFAIVRRLDELRRLDKVLSGRSQGRGAGTG